MQTSIRGLAAGGAGGERGQWAAGRGDVCAQVISAAQGAAIPGCPGILQLDHGHWALDAVDSSSSSSSAVVFLLRQQAWVSG